MRKLLFLVLACLCLILPGCNVFSSPGGTYRDADLAFNYPPGWSVSAKEVGRRMNHHAVVARGPDNAVLILICMPAGSTMSLRNFAESFARQRDEKVEQRGRIGSHSFFNPGPSTLEASRERVAGTEVDGFRQSFSLSIFGIAVPFESHFSLISDSQRSLFIATQNSVRGHEPVPPAYAVMLGSLRLLPGDAARGN